MDPAGSLLSALLPPDPAPSKGLRRAPGVSSEMGPWNVSQRQLGEDAAEAAAGADSQNWAAVSSAPRPREAWKRGLLARAPETEEVSVVWGGSNEQ